MLSGMPIWTPLSGSFSKLKEVRMTGSYAAGTLTVEATSILSKNLVTSTNKFIDGKWVFSKSKPVPLKNE